MPENSVDRQHYVTFEGIHHIGDEGHEFWLARPLAKVLDYSEYRHFLPVVEWAREACRNSGPPMEDHFEDILEMGKNQKILDHMGSTELAANLFRATQTEEKLRRDEVRGKTQANRPHFEVDNEVRQTIQELGGTMPENLPKPEISIQQIASAKRKLEKKSHDPGAAATLD
ncbi:MAG: hypothetical protein KAX51_04290 [Chromatiaceae bacterium]|nr:hypothetical protein [Chromatiaceae bacterium]MBP8289017.1 hypothetical protein [Chromatiaceae bacterium]